MEITKHKNKLEALKENITNELKTIAVHRFDTDDWELQTEPVEQDAADPNDHADIAEDSEERMAVFRDLKQRYRNITRALQKIVDGTYGICEITGEPIEPERLEVHPAARTCIAHRDEERTLPQ